jgi:hypothetical protein
MRVSLLQIFFPAVVLGSVVALVTPSGVAHAAFAEFCDNCVDDDGDDLIDRADPDCNPFANGGGAGIDDTVRGKALVKCHKGIEKAGLAFSSKRLKRLYACATPAFACVQTKAGDPTCLTAAGTKCAGQLAGAGADQNKLLALIAKACDPAVVSRADLDLDLGLGFGKEAAECLNEGSPLNASIGSLAACVLQQHVCHTNRTLSAGVPRARELFIGMGRNPDGELLCLDVGSDGGGQGLGDFGKPALKCQQGIIKASLKLGSAVAKTFQKCVDLGVACLQQKNADPPCVTAAAAKCQKLSDKAQDRTNGTLFKILGAAAKSCGGISTEQLQQSAGLGFEAQSDRCIRLEASQGDVQGTIACAGVQQSCESKQMLLREIPRFEEFLALLNVQILGL